jgi:hypothetical protein
MQCWILATIIFTVTTGISIDDLPDIEQNEAILERVFPLRNIALPWDSIDWKKYSKVVVVGPQRSGTTFFSDALAKHLKYFHHDEGRDMTYQTFRHNRSRPFKVPGNANASSLDLIRQSPMRTVLQRPQWSSDVHNLELGGDDVFVAFLARNCLDVFRSQNGIGVHSNDQDNAGWTCKFGRTVEWLPYHT